MQAHLPEAPENVQSGNQVSLAFKITSDRLRRWRMLNYQSRSVSTGNRAGRSKASRNIFIIYFSRVNFEILLYNLFSLSLLIVSWFTFFVLGFFSTFHPALFNMYLFFFYFFIVTSFCFCVWISWKKVSLQEITLTVLKVAVAHVVLNCEFGLVDQPVWTGKKWVIWICERFCRLFSLTPWIF